MALKCALIRPTESSNRRRFQRIQGHNHCISSDKPSCFGRFQLKNSSKNIYFLQALCWQTRFGFGLLSFNKEMDDLTKLVIEGNIPSNYIERRNFGAFLRCPLLSFESLNETQLFILLRNTLATTVKILIPSLEISFSNLTFCLLMSNQR